MNHSELSDVLCDAPEIIRPEYFAALGECELYYLHFDDREPGVIAGFYFHNASGDLVRRLEGSPGDNTVSFFVSFRDVREFSVNGWGVARASVFTLDFIDDGLLAVGIRGEETRISFACSQVTIDRVKTYNAGKS
jgi:hypothetical protein